MTAILGISAFYHDSAAALVVDGAIVAAAQEERFTRKKHDEGFPQQAIDYCLAEAGVTPAELDYVGFYEKPFLKFDRLLQTYVAFAPAGFPSFVKAMPSWLREKLHVSAQLRKGLGGDFRKRFVFTEHHESHAASAFFPSPFDEAAVLTLDGVGEWATASLGTGRANRIELHSEFRFPHSLGMLYSAFTYFTGFRVNSGEYKLMGLAPYGQPIYAERILEHLLDLREDGSFRLDLRYFNYCHGLTMTSRRFDRLFDGPPRRPDGPITRREMDLAASVQLVTEEVMLRCARHAHEVTGMRNLCLAGGVALNCVGNGRILKETPFERVWIQPAAGDAGGALGVALFIWYQLMGNQRLPEAGDSQRGSLLGPQFGIEEIRSVLDNAGAVYGTIDDETELCDTVASLLADGNVVGWFHGRMEFGPRALGGRSILGDPRNPDMQSVMNRKIKFRESFRPFAPSVLRDHVEEWFELTADDENPYMLIVAPVAASRRLDSSGDTPSTGGLEDVTSLRSQIPAVTHVDFSARVQTVDRQRHGRYHRLLESFYRLTGCPVVINTSFNVRGEPIVCTPEEAYRCFMATNMDVLVLEDVVVHKHLQGGVDTHETERYLAAFAPD